MLQRTASPVKLPRTISTDRVYSGDTFLKIIYEFKMALRNS
jgi:hypothetical protein